MKNNEVIGMDLGDKKHRICVLDAEGEIVEERALTNSAASLRKYFGGRAKVTVVMEAGTHSPWISRLLAALGHEVLVGNPRKLRVIWQSDRKDDRRDAHMLARMGRFDAQLLYPITHRGSEAQASLAVIKARDALVRVRSDLVNHVRGSVKASGERLPACSTEAFARRAAEKLPEALAAALEPVVEQIGVITGKIRDYDRQIEKMCREAYPETKRLMQVGGVGPVTSLAYVLTLECPERFESSRSVGPFLGLSPRRDQSGESDRQLRITKAGDEYLRRLLVGSAHYILGPFGKPCALRRFGERLAARGGKNAKKRAVVAVARKLAVLLHHLWESDELYLPEGKTRESVKHAA